MSCGLLLATKRISNGSGWRCVGDRSTTSALRLWQQLPRDYAACPSFSDRWAAYGEIVDSQRHQSAPKTEGATNHVERWFNTLGQRLARFTRTTLAFSENQTNHEAIVHMFMLDYNLTCISQRVTTTASSKLTFFYTHQ